MLFRAVFVATTIALTAVGLPVTAHADPSFCDFNSLDYDPGRCADVQDIPYSCDPAYPGYNSAVCEGDMGALRG